MRAFEAETLSFRSDNFKNVFFDGKVVKKVDVVVYNDGSTKVSVFGDGETCLIDKKKRIYKDNFGDFHIFSCEKLESVFYECLGL